MQMDEKIDQAFNELCQPIIQTADPNDLISVRITHSDLTKGPIFLTFHRASTFSAQPFTNRIYEVTQSNSSFLMDGEFEITISILKGMSGGMPSRHRYPQSAGTSRRHSKSIVQVVNKHNDCGYKAVYLAEYRRKNFSRPALWKSITTALATEASRSVTGMITTDNNTALVNWKYTDDTKCREGNVNVAIACFITSYARRELWRSLNEIESAIPDAFTTWDTGLHLLLR